MDAKKKFISVNLSYFFLLHKQVLYGFCKKVTHVYYSQSWVRHISSRKKLLE